MILVAGVALALIVLALAGAGHGSEEIVRRLAGQKDPRVVSAAADVLAGRGMRLTAEALRARARDLSTGATTAGEPAAGPTSWTPPVPADVWKRFVRALKGSPLRARSAAGRLGMFSTHLRRLEELGYVKGVCRRADGVVTAEWVAPFSERGFLSDPRLQYRVLLETFGALAPLIAQTHASALGRALGRHTVSLSGLLAVAHRLGLPGLDAWLSSKAERARQRIATGLFEHANGLF